MGVIAFAGTVLFNNLDNLLAVPEQHVRDSGADGHVPADLGHDLGGREPGEADLLELCFVEEEVVIEDGALIEGRAVEVEQLLREEGEVLSVPDVEVVDDAECDTLAQQIIRKDE